MSLSGTKTLVFSRFSNEEDDLQLVSKVRFETSKNAIAVEHLLRPSNI